MKRFEGALLPGAGFAVAGEALFFILKLFIAGKSPFC